MKGGLRLLAVQDREFKYTRSAQRIQWTKHVFPIGQYLLQIVRQIPWTSYEFRGEIDLFSANDDAAKPDEYAISKVPIETKWSIVQKKVEVPITKPYYFFGGCVYEILNTLIPDISLREYVDPTGDVDVMVSLPTILTADRDTYFIDYFLKADGTMNELLDDYTRWLTLQVETQLRNFGEPLFDKLFEKTVPFDFKEHAESASSDLQKPYKNIWIVRIPQYDKGMIKIQVICKFEGLEPDQCIELVLRIHNEKKLVFLNNSTKDFEKERMNIGEMSLQPFHLLLQGNLSGMTDRKRFFDNILRHKFYNHVGRIQYLNTFFSFEGLRNQIPDVHKLEFQYNLLYLLHYFIESREAGELGHFSHDGSVLGKAYTDDAMMDSLMIHLIPFLYSKYDMGKSLVIPVFTLDGTRYRVDAELAKFHLAGSAPAGGGKARRTLRNRRRKIQQTRKRRQRKMRRR